MKLWVRKLWQKNAGLERKTVLDAAPTRNRERTFASSMILQEQNSVIWQEGQVGSTGVGQLLSCRRTRLIIHFHGLRTFLLCWLIRSIRCAVENWILDSRRQLATLPVFNYVLWNKAGMRSASPKLKSHSDFSLCHS